MCELRASLQMVPAKRIAPVHDVCALIHPVRSITRYGELRTHLEIRTAPATSASRLGLLGRALYRDLVSYFLFLFIYEII